MCALAYRTPTRMLPIIIIYLSNVSWTMTFQTYA